MREAASRCWRREREEEEAAAAQVEAVQLTCQMAALAGSAARERRRVLQYGASPPDCSAVSGSKRRSNFADVCVLRDFDRHWRELMAYGRINTDKLDGCRRCLALEFEMSHSSKGTHSLSDIARELFSNFKTTPDFVL